MQRPSPIFLLKFIIVCLLVGCANRQEVNIEFDVPVSERSAFLMVFLGHRAHYVKKMMFRNVDTGLDYVIEVRDREFELLMLPVPPGSYYLRRMDSVFVNAMSRRFEQPKDLLEFDGGNVYYLGDINYRYNAVFVDFSKEAVEMAKKSNPILFSEGRKFFVFNHLFGNYSVSSVKFPAPSGLR